MMSWTSTFDEPALSIPSSPDASVSIVDWGANVAIPDSSSSSVVDTCHSKAPVLVWKPFSQNGQKSKLPSCGSSQSLAHYMVSQSALSSRQEFMSIFGGDREKIIIYMEPNDRPATREHRGGLVASVFASYFEPGVVRR